MLLDNLLSINSGQEKSSFQRHSNSEFTSCNYEMCKGVDIFTDLQKVTEGKNSQNIYRR